MEIVELSENRYQLVNRGYGIKTGTLAECQAVMARTCHVYAKRTPMIPFHNGYGRCIGCGKS